MKNIQKIIFILVFVFAVTACKDISSINKHLIYFNYNTNEICIMDIKTGNIEKKHRLKMEILRGGGINNQGFSYKWHYKNNDINVYLMEKSWSSSGRLTTIYKINIDDFNITEIFKTNTPHRANLFYFNFFINDNELFLTNLIEQSNQGHNKEFNYIILYNLLTKDETIINFNILLPEEDQIYASDIFVYNDSIIFTGYRDNYDIIQKRLFRYDITENLIYLIDEHVRNFSIINNLLLYDKYNKVEINIDQDFVKTIVLDDINLNIYNLEDNTYSILPYNENYYFDYLNIDNNRIIYSDWYISEPPLYSIGLPYIDNRQVNYYIAAINKYEKKLLFSSPDRLLLLGVLDKN
ncbi:MAG: hypothetical protein FWD28_05520 [Treponema sp.]|nr:hypothetical protein [Treponema sp.]